MSMNQTTSTLPPTEPIDTRDLRRALGTFLTGVTVVTCVDELGRPRGFTANSFTSVSLDPPLVLVCIARSAESFGAFVGADGFCVNVLGECQKSVSQIFASKSAKKFQSVPWSPGCTGAPRLRDNIAWFDCSTQRRVTAGDHVVLIGKVERFSASGGRPLGYCQGGYLGFGLADRAVEQRRSRTVFGCIIGEGDRVLLCRRRGDSAWTLPSTSLMADGDAGHQALGEILGQMRLAAELGFLFSVYDVPRRRETHVFYRGSLSGPLPARADGAFQARLFGPAEIPWSDFSLAQTRSMLRRYLSEQAADSFGIYMDGFGNRRLVSVGGAREHRGAGQHSPHERGES
jgi:flavin reductase (DIM6/NTAB) family NADH-FMN oxidoreductase RutF/ADP-ribose pyrophosphatase YjhB (NUDIX family)